MNSALSLIPMLFLSLTCAVRAAPWPGWRGTDGCGISSQTDLPSRWNGKDQVEWKVALPEPGNSTPIVQTNASPAISDGNIDIRTHAHLWCNGE